MLAVRLTLRRHSRNTHIIIKIQRKYKSRERVVFLENVQKGVSNMSGFDAETDGGFIMQKEDTVVQEVNDFVCKNKEL